MVILTVLSLTVLSKPLPMLGWCLDLTTVRIYSEITGQSIVHVPQLETIACSIMLVKKYKKKRCKWGTLFSVIF